MKKVLTATAIELGRSGYAALRVEDVAARCGVNKTTIYRRWPTKPELVQATVSSLARTPDMPDTGTLRGDLLAHFEQLCAFVRSQVGRGVVRTLQVERTHPELESVAKRLRADQRALRRKLFERAVKRGELSKNADLELLTELAAAPLIARIVHHDPELDMAFVEAALDVLLAGARALTR